VDRSPSSSSFGKFSVFKQSSLSIMSGAPQRAASFQHTKNRQPDYGDDSDDEGRVEVVEGVTGDNSLALKKAKSAGPAVTSNSAAGQSMDDIEEQDLSHSTYAYEEAQTENMRSTQTTFTVFKNHFTPDKTTNYFAADEIAGCWQNWRVCAVVFPFFNEEKRELQRSLMSMYKQAQQLFKYEMRVHVVCIMDGWFKSSPSMKEYMKELYPPEDVDNPWWDEIAEGGPSSQVYTYVLQRTLITEEGRRRVGLVDIGPKMKLKVTMLIKRDNRRKHNSHEWFFQSFCKEYNADYAFATDCGTLYHSQCVAHLIKFMDDNEGSAGVTARQRVMTAKMQGTVGEGLMARWYRALQAYDYEASISSFQGAFALSGMLPVLPGPCGMYRYRDIKGEALDYYFDTVNADPNKMDMVQGNLLLAEDRILSYAAALKTGKRTSWVPHATFYFEAETESEKFIAQRRRWSNGAFAGYIYFLSNPDIVWDSDHTSSFKFFVMFLQWIQFMIYMIVSVSPALFASSFWYSLNSKYVWQESWDASVPTYIGAAYCFVYVVYVLGHTFIKWLPPLFYLAALMNAIGIVIVVYVAGRSLVAGISEHGISGLWGSNLLILMFLCIMTMPFLLSLANSVKSFLFMVLNFIPYILLLPTFVGWFAAYAYARSWDLTWGNRPSDAVSHGETRSAKQIKKAAFEIKLKGRIIAFFLVFLNTWVLLGVTHITSQTIYAVVACFVLGFAFTNMLLSACYYLYYTPIHTFESCADCFRACRPKKNKVIIEPGMI